MSNSLDPDQDCVGPDLGPKRSQRLSTEDKSRPAWKVIMFMQGFFLVSSGAEIWPLSQWDSGDFFSQFEKKIPTSKKKKKKKNFFFFRIFILSPHTHTHTHTHKLHDDNHLELHPIFLQFIGNSMWCNS